MYTKDILHIGIANSKRKNLAQYIHALAATWTQYWIGVPDFISSIQIAYQDLVSNCKQLNGYS